MDLLSKVVDRSASQVSFDVAFLSGEIVAKLSLPGTTTLFQVRQHLVDNHADCLPSVDCFKLILPQQTDGKGAEDDSTLASLRLPLGATLHAIRLARRAIERAPEDGTRDAATYKVVMLGDSGVGKSCLVLRWAGAPFNHVKRTTIGLDCRGVHALVDGGLRVRLQFWDIAGQRRLRHINNSMITDAAAFVAVFDVTNQASFEQIELLLDDMAARVPAGYVACLVGTHVDMVSRRQVPAERVESFAMERGLPYFEVSSRYWSTQFDEPWHWLIGAILDGRNVLP